MVNTPRRLPGGLFNGLWLAILVILPPAARAEVRATERAVIVISIDGLAAFYLDDPRAEMPTIRELAATGAGAARMKVSAPSVTWPNHTTLVTGVSPARHGVVGNDYFDRAVRRKVVLMTDPESDKPVLVRVPTIYDIAKQAGMSTAALRWPATRSAPTLDWTFPDVFSDELLHRYATPSLVAECKQAGVWADGERVKLGQQSFEIVSDETCTRVFRFILREHQPRLALLHLTDVDNIEHLKGPQSPEAYAAIKAADSRVREIWQEARQVYSERASILIVSDHGFVPIEQLVSPNIILRQAGLVTVEGEKVTGGDVHVVGQGGAALVYVLDAARRDTLVEQIRNAFAKVEGIAKIVRPGQMHEHRLAEPSDEPRAPDVMLLARPGFGFDERATGDEAVVRTAQRRGGHGHDEHLPELDAVFIAWGAGIRRGARLGEIENISVAPTIARLLGLAMPNVDGQPLAAALDE